MEGFRSGRVAPYWLLGFGWVLLGLCLMVLVLLVNIRQAEQDFIRGTNELHDRLVQRLSSSEVVLAGFAAHFSVKEGINPSKVRRYARKMLEHYPHIYQLEAQIKVAAAELEAFEARMRNAGYPRYKVRSFNYESDRRWQDVSPRAFYYPIYFMEPLIPEAVPVLGLDVFSLAHLRKAIVEVARTAQMVASSPLELVEGGRAYILFAAVDGAPAAAPGSALGHAQFPDIIVSLVVRTAELIAGDKLTGQDDVTLYDSGFDVTDPAGWIYRHLVPDAHSLTRVGLPRFFDSRALEVPGHPFVLQVTRQLTWNVAKTSPLIAVGGFFLITSWVLAFYIRSRQVSEEQREAATRALAAERDLLNGITATAVSAIVVFDRAGVVTFANQRAESILGLARQAGGWRSARNRECLFIPCEGHCEGSALPLLQRIVDSGQPLFGAHYALRCPDGSHKQLSINAAPLKQSAGAVSHVVCALEDITERRRAEERLKQNEIQLREQARQLTEADRRKDEFLALLGHELRNPLAAIRNAVVWLQGHPEYLHPQARWAQEVIGRQVRGLARLVDDLLDVSRITQGRIELRLAPTSLAEVVSRAVETVCPTIDGRRQTLEVSLPRAPLWLHGDVIRLAQVFGNLLDNASKYTQAGEKLWLTVAQEGDEAVVSVRDNGVGIPAYMMAHIFEPFQRGNGGRGSHHGGLGLGLSLVRDLVTRHGGQVNAFSAGPQRGSEFIVRLPVWVGETRAQMPARRVVKGFRPPPTAAKRVLVVDDEADAATSLAMLLHTMGHEAYTASDGPDALTAVTRLQPQVVILDLGLPGMDGYEIARRLRRTHTSAMLLLIALTGYGQEAHRRRSATVGIDSYLTKPVDDLTLESLIGSFVPCGH